MISVPTTVRTKASDEVSGDFHAHGRPRRIGIGGPSHHLFLSVAILLAALSLMFAATAAQALQGHECSFTFGQQGTGEGQFSDPEGVAVDEFTGRIYVVDTGNDRVEFFSAAGQYEGEIDGATTPGGPFSQPREIAVDNSSGPSKGDVYVVDGGHKVIDKFTSAGEYIEQLSGTPEHEVNGEKIPGRVFWGGQERGAISVAVDRSGQLWVAFSSSEVKQEEKWMAVFGAEAINTLLKEFEPLNVGGSLQPGLAVDSQGDSYLKGNFIQERGGFAETIEKLDSSGKVLNPKVGGAVLNPKVGGALGNWPAVESSTDDVYIGQTTRVSRYTPSGESVEELAVGQLIEAAGIAVDAPRGTVYIADSSADKVYGCPLESPRKATVEGLSVAEVSATGATFKASLNPRGAETQYHFEYGVCEMSVDCDEPTFEVSVPVPDGALASTFEASLVYENIQDLSPGTSYHYRLTATNSFGEVASAVKTFRTGSASSSTLADNRVWELVSPPDANGTLIEPIGETGVTQASVAGDKITYITTASVHSGDAHGQSVYVQVLATRNAGVWSSTDLALSHKVPTEVFPGLGNEYRFFSPDLSTGIAEPAGPFSPPEYNGQSEASPTPTERTPYLRHNATCEASPTACYAPILVGGENVTSGAKFGGATESPLGVAEFVGATPDDSHVVISSAVQLTEQSAPHGGIYEWDAASGDLSLASLLPVDEGGLAAPTVRFGSSAMQRDAISTDGNRVIFTASAPGQEQNHLYVRDMSLKETLRLDVAEGGSAPNQLGGSFQAATSEGDRVFFTDFAPLTKSSGVSGADLYECQIAPVGEAGSEKLSCPLNDLTGAPEAPQPHSGEPADVQSAILGIGGGGSYVYFVANGVQANGASPGNCSAPATPGQACNLYVRHAGLTHLITRLSADDYPDWVFGRLNALTARVSENGVWLAFMSDMPLTGYDNHDAASGRLDEEVYLYNAVSETLACVSCNPSGEQPAGLPYLDLGINAGLVGGDRVWNNDQWLAANIPGWTPYRQNLSLYQSRYLSNSGRMFFNSSDSLVGRDTNGNEDVYEFEPVGVGPDAHACSQSSPSYDSSTGGCVTLISSGLGVGQSAFLDASANGGDVFFLTFAKLAKQDVGSGLDIYDAHECSPVSPCSAERPTSTPECTSAASCRTAPMTQPAIFGAPPSATFTGRENVSSQGRSQTKSRTLSRSQKLSNALKACKRLKRRSRRAACQARARKRYGSKASARKVASKPNKKAKK